MDTARIDEFAHTGPDTPAGRFMRAFWQPVGLSDDLKPEVRSRSRSWARSSRSIVAHGWKYDQTGQCVQQAIEHPSFASKVRIRSFPARYPEYESRVVVDPVTYRVPYNFFQNMENS